MSLNNYIIQFFYYAINLIFIIKHAFINRNWELGYSQEIALLNNKHETGYKICSLGISLLQIILLFLD
jgi:hypothetical protein